MIMPNIQSYIVQSNFNRYDNTAPFGPWYTYQSDISLNLIDPHITDPPYIGYGYIYRVGAVYTTGTAYSAPFNCPIAYAPSVPAWPQGTSANPNPDAFADSSKGVYMLVKLGFYKYNSESTNVWVNFIQPDNENITSYIVEKQLVTGIWESFEPTPSHTYVDSYSSNSKEITIFDAYPSDNYTSSDVLAYRVRFVNAKGPGPWGYTGRPEIDPAST